MAVQLASSPFLTPLLDESHRSRLCSKRAPFTSKHKLWHKSLTPKTRSVSLTTAAVEINVCTNKVCRKEGAAEILRLFEDLAPKDVVVTGCGCLGKCGAGPNVLLQLPDEELFLRRVDTRERVAQLMEAYAGVGGWEANARAFGLRAEALEAANKGDLGGAERLLSEAITLQPSGGLHVLHACRVEVRMAQKQLEAALEDAERAAELAPGWAQAQLKLGDVHMARGEGQAAAEALERAVQLDPTLRRSKGFQRRVLKLQQQMAAVA